MKVHLLGSQKKNARKIITCYNFSIISLLCCYCFFSTVQGQEPAKKITEANSNHSEHKHKESNSAQETNSVSELVIPDVEILTQDGKKLKFKTDLVKGKRVLISFIYTSCGLTCPLVGRNFENLQKAVGEDLGKDIFFISVSTDPAFDTPQILKKWGEKYNRREGWTLVTGEASEINRLLMDLTGGGPQRGLHSSKLILLDGVSGAWDTTSSLLDSKRLLYKLDQLGKSSTKK